MEDSELVELKKRFETAKDNQTKENLVHLCKEYNRINRGGFCCGCAWKRIFKIVEAWIGQL